jgi:hypothetical protein
VVALNEVTFRSDNERVKDWNLAQTWVNPPEPDWSCECGWENCTEPVRLSRAEYEAVREHPTRFFIVPDEGHVSPNVERVIERNDRYWVVEKLGRASEISVALDPRAIEPEPAT